MRSTAVALKNLGYLVIALGNGFMPELNSAPTHLVISDALED